MFNVFKIFKDMRGECYFVSFAQNTVSIVNGAGINPCAVFLWCRDSDKI
jgi:hypothetical protein